jgi:glutathione S-transferase
MNELLGLQYSPWSEKARWALDARHIPYRSRPYQPLVGEPQLRLKLRRPWGKVSVPVLTTDDGVVIADSAEIARWADGRGEGPQLFPSDLEAGIARMIELSERALSAGRALALRRTLADEEALAEMVPRGIRRALGSRARELGAFGIRRTLRKYGGAQGGPDGRPHRSTLVAALDEVRAKLARSNDSPRTLFGRFTFADIAVAQTLAFVDPPTLGLKLGPANRRSFTDPELRETYGDLVEWRNALYAAFRAPPLH